MEDFDEYEGLDYEDEFDPSEFFDDEDDDQLEESEESEETGVSDKPDKPDKPIESEEIEKSDESDEQDSEVLMFDEDDSFYFDEDEEDESGHDDSVSYEEQMQLFSTEIFASVLSGEDGWKEQVQVFKTRLDPRLFRNEEFFLAKIINKYIRDKLIEPRIIELLLKQNIKEISSVAGKYVDLENYKDIKGAKEYGFIDSVVERYKDYRKGTLMDMDDFVVDIDAYKSLYQQVHTVKVMQKGIEIATTGTGTGRSRQIGLNDAMNYVKLRFADISGLLEDQEGKGFVDMRETLADTGDKQKSQFICTFGDIPTLNKAYGGLYTGNFYQIMGPPKGGKSKKCAELCYNAIMQGENVSVWPQEGGMEMWSAQMRAIHCNRYHNKGKSPSDVISDLPSQGEILKDELSPVIKSLEDTSRLDLQTNPTYGHVNYIDRPFLLETFIEEIDTSVQANGSKLVIIDYLQLIDTESTRLAGHEVLKQAYKKLLNYCKKTNVAILTPVQFTQEAVSALASGDTAKVDMRVSAGGSAEVIRTPDMTIPMWATEQELEQGITYIQPMPNRLGPVLPRIKMYVDLAHCTFVEADD